MNIQLSARLGCRLGSVVALLALAACSSTPEPVAVGPDAGNDTTTVARTGPDALLEPSIEPRPDPVPPGALPEPGMERRDAEARAQIDVLHYDLEVDLSRLADSLFVARAALDLRAAPGSERVDLDFVGLRVDSVRIGGARVPFAQGPDLLRVQPDGGFEGETTVEVFYGGTPRDGLFIGPDPASHPTAFVDNWPNRARWWFPSNDHPPDKASAEFHVRAPDGYSVVANGRHLGTEDDVWRWRTDVEIPAYTMVIGVAPFERADLGRAACAAAPRAADGDCAAVSVWALTGGGEYGERRFERAPDMLDFYTEMFGPYPYEKLAHVQSSTRFGGMENSSAIFYAMGSWADQEMGESVIAHETVHQWFGDHVTPEAWSHLWVSEGFATYFAAVYFGERDGPDAFRASMASNRRSIVGSDASNRPVVDERTDLFGLLNTNSYQKGAWILHMLREMLGDEAFFAAIRAYYADHAGGSAGTDDVRRAMELAAGGEDLGWFFEQWAYSPGFPRLEVSTRLADDAAIVTIEQVQSADWPTFRLPLDVEVRAADGRVERREIWMEGRSEMLRFPWTAGAVELHIDPDGRLLAEVVTGE